ncbi:MAG: hypothetical protein K8L99_10715 [Anaerolineae bacterium]|nr:hypothetical protein [Anaerolineae bacterium]
MSDFYILALLKEDVPIIDVDSFRDELGSVWDLLNIRELDSNEHEILAWDMDIDGSVVTCHLGNDRNSISLDGAIKPIAKFAVWYKKHIVHEYLLSLFEQSYQHGTMEITDITTEKEIVEVFWS